MTHTELSFVAVSLDGLGTNTALLGGPREAIEGMVLALETSLVTYSYMDEETAKAALLKNGMEAGIGYYIGDDVDLLKDEARRATAYSKLIYLCKRLGRGSLFHPVRI